MDTFRRAETKLAGEKQQDIVSFSLKIAPARNIGLL